MKNTIILICWCMLAYACMVKTNMNSTRKLLICDQLFSSQIIIIAVYNLLQMLTFFSPIKDLSIRSHRSYGDKF